MIGLLRTVLLLPIKGPLDGVVWVAGKIDETAQREWRDPGTIRLALRDLEDRLLAGTISEADYDSAEADLLARLQDTP